MTQNVTNIIQSPFLFAGLSQQVHIPKWQKVNQDLPFQEALCGSFELRIETQTPTLVADEQKGMEKRFFTLPDQTPAIPGTSLKGMIRSLLEAVTLSRMTQINDTKLSYRDLHSDRYRNKLTKTLGKAYETRTKSGWLKFENGEWQLRSTQVFRIENADIERAFKVQIKDREAEKIYKMLGGIKAVTFRANPIEEHKHSGNKYLKYAKADQFQKGADKGWLIVTGQVSGTQKGPGKKHMNFIFQEPQQLETFRNPNVMKDFLADATKSNSQNDSKIFQYLQNLKHKNGIPVFYLTNEEGLVESLGLAQMYRIPYENSIGDLRPQDHKNFEKGVDFATLLFGDISNSHNAKGRVSFGLAKLMQPATPRFTQTGKIVLGGPKANFYPSYLNQNTTEPKKYNDYDSKDAKLAGRKHYLIQKEIQKNIPLAPTESVASVLHPIESGHVFQGTVRFHNINSVELGALIWAITLGESSESDYYHNLGMGKAYGFGKVRLSLKNLMLDHARELDADEFVKQFYLYSLTQIRSTLALKEIKALHRQTELSPTEIAYPKMGMQRGENDFAAIKESRKESMRKLTTLKQSQEDEWLKQVHRELEEAIKAQQQVLERQAKEEEQRRQAEREVAQALEKAAEQKQKEQERLSNRSAFEVLFEDTMGAQISKQTLTLLVENPALYQNLSEEEQIQLKNKIEVSGWFKGLNKKRADWRKKLPDLLRG